jgi:hypothetical protein
MRLLIAPFTGIFTGTIITQNAGEIGNKRKNETKSEKLWKNR